MTPTDAANQPETDTSETDTADEVTAFYHQDGDFFVPSHYTEGPWAPETQAGNATSGLLAWGVDQVPTLTPMRTVRCTFDLFRPAPMRPLELRSHILREGKRIQVVETSLWEDGVQYAACRALRMREGEASPPDLDNPVIGPIELPPPPSGLPPWGEHDPSLFPGSVWAFDARVPDTEDPRWSTTLWVRSKISVVDNGPRSEVARVASIADWVSNSANHADRAAWYMINADLSLAVFRQPTSDWLALVIRTGFSPDGIGHSVGWILDESGHVATAMTLGMVEPYQA